MNDASYRRACVTAGESHIKDLRRVLTKIEKDLRSSVDEDVKTGFLNAYLLQTYVSKQLPVDFVKALAAMPGD